MLALLLFACSLSSAPNTGEEYIAYYAEEECNGCWEGRGFASEEECVEARVEQWSLNFVDVAAVCPDSELLDGCVEAIGEASCYDFANGVNGLDCFPTALLSEENCETDDTGG